MIGPAGVAALVDHGFNGELAGDYRKSARPRRNAEARSDQPGFDDTTARITGGSRHPLLLPQPGGNQTP